MTGARALGKTVIVGAHRAFGPPPDRFPQLLMLDATARDATALDPGSRDTAIQGPPRETPSLPATDDGWRLPGT